MGSRKKNDDVKCSCQATTVLRVLAALTCMLVISTGVISCVINANWNYSLGTGDSVRDNIMTSRNAGWVVFCASVLVCIFGLFGILAETNVCGFALRAIPMLKLYWTKIPFYVIMGALSFGMCGDLGFVTTGFCAIMVIAWSIAACCLDHDPEDKF
eukprot:TRINITY_DN1908_c0_g1_i1.p1 TRINITY_DN1908_c0_g1~~TRINITY_DN1908_c0_g1_i1.p1  ORF type:complete len:156 (+),score=20.68 TRINITY_DN1908_c0_g1_i1:29-496(+)